MRYLALTLLSCLLLWSCHQRTVFFSYHALPLSGWNADDVQTFHIDTLAHTATYDLQLAIRANNSFPFQALWIEVEQQWQSPTQIQRDTVICRLADAQGDIEGAGIALYQYTFPIAQLQLVQGQTGNIRLRHIMRRETLPGLSDIGLRLYQE